jgi:hypothetical protein
MKTFILGAGASRHAGYPLAKRLGDDLLKWMRNQENYPISLSSAIEFLEGATDGSTDFEEILTEFDRRVSIPDDAPLDERVQRAIAAEARFGISEGIRGYFREVRSGPAEAYRSLAENLVAAGDAILTFNYDVSLERELSLCGKWCAKDGYGFEIDGPDKSSPVQVFKLHGSTNWMASLFQGRRGTFGVSGGSLGGRPILGSDELKFLGCTERDRLFPAGGTAALPVMILPTRAKVFSFNTSFGNEFGDFWNLLWMQAALALAKSDEIYVCGYSLPSVDERARQLIFEYIDKSARVEISCGGDTNHIADEFRAAGFANVIASDKTHFEDWVRSRTVEVV